MTSDNKGVLEWMAGNPVAANLLMFVIVLGGLLSAFTIKQEVFPEFTIDAVQVSVAYPGASPTEVERGILLAIEEAVTGLDGVEEVRSTASTGIGTVTIELMTGFDRNAALSDVKVAVDGIRSFPEDAEEPAVTTMSQRQQVVSMLVTGEQELAALEVIAEALRFELLEHPDISQVEIVGLAASELSIEVPSGVLEALNLTLDDVALQISRGSIETPGGSIKTESQELMVRVSDRRLRELDFASLPIVAGAAGQTVFLGDIAEVSEGYEETSEQAFLDGQRALRIDVYRVGEESPATVAAASRLVAEAQEVLLPEDISIVVWSDDSLVLTERLSLLTNNAVMGLILVVVVLGLFLDLRVALWVAAGIPISFLGAFLVMPLLGVSINMISLFALLVVLGLVVDDAVIVGEEIFNGREKGLTPDDAAITGARRMVGPVFVAICTTIAAFGSLLGLPGSIGKIFAVFPLVVIAVLLFSFVESFLILPAHLGHGGESRIWRLTDGVRERVAGMLKKFIEGVYTPMMEWVLTHRYLAISSGLGLFILCLGLVAGGWVPLVFFPALKGDVITATAVLPAGSVAVQQEQVLIVLQDAAARTIEKGGEPGTVIGVYSRIWDGTGGGKTVTVELALQSDAERTLGVDDYEALWLAEIPPLASIESLIVSSATGPSAGAAMEVELAHADVDVLAAASMELAEYLAGFADLANIDNEYSSGSPQLDLQLSPRGAALGLTSRDVSKQVRAAFEGAEALREQVGRSERRVMVRLPEAQRRSRADIDDLPIRLPAGGFVNLSTVVNPERKLAPAKITRTGNRRQVLVSADLASGADSTADITATLQKGYFDELKSRYPGLGVGLAGDSEDLAEVMGVLVPNFAVGMFVIFGLLAGIFRSYLQPVIIMIAIPFGLIGAILGHLLLGYSMSIVSLFGVIALAGVVVNDSLVLIDAANEMRANDMPARQAILAAGQRRFRPIMLTSVTTFMGMVPMLLETAPTTKFLIPMAISLSFGIVFATVVILVLIPAFYLVVEDLWALFSSESTSGSVPDINATRAVDL